MMKKTFTVLLVLLLLSCNFLTASAMNSGFDLGSVSNDRESQIKNNIEISVFKEEMVGNTIECFDVNDDGMIALGTKKSNRKYISIYNSQGVFQYGYQFDSNGSFGVEWDSNDIIIYFVRSDLACSVNSVGKIQEIMDIKDTTENNSYWNNNVFVTTRTIENVEYKIQNDLGILNYIATSYSQLVIQDSNGQMKTIYDVNSQQLFKMIFAFVCITLFSFICLLIVRTQGDGSSVLTECTILRSVGG